jgi:hypothetical protein
VGREEKRREGVYKFITKSIFEFKRFLSACKKKGYKIIIINSKRKCCVIMCIVVVQFVY